MRLWKSAMLMCVLLEQLELDLFGLESTDSVIIDIHKLLSFRRSRV